MHLMRVAVSHPVSFVGKLLIRVVAAGAEIIKNAALFRVSYDLICVLYVTESLLSLQSPAIFVRVKLETQFQVRFTDLTG